MIFSAASAARIRTSGSSPSIPLKSGANRAGLLSTSATTSLARPIESEVAALQLFEDAVHRGARRHGVHAVWHWLGQCFHVGAAS